jgi:hypothetical protein
VNTLQTYDIGDLIKLEVRFINDAGDPAEPTTVKLTLLKPNGSYVFHDFADVGTTIVAEGEGVYSLTITAQYSGKHNFRWEATGPGAGSEEGYFWVSLNKLAGAVAGG